MIDFEKVYLALIQAKERADFLRHYRDEYVVAPLNNKTLLLTCNNS